MGAKKSGSNSGNRIREFTLGKAEGSGKNQLAQQHGDDMVSISQLIVQIHHLSERRPLLS